MAKNSDKQPSFEDSLGALEKLVQEIEVGNVGLEDSLSKYEQGMQLIARCRQILQAAERRIEIVTQTGNAVQTAPLDSAALLQAAAGGKEAASQVGL